ncbi:hypothetical protein Q674_01855 [Acinetobacter sp. COS3]|uniref:type IV pilus assembly protein FimV n=1 Tax=Acinetobacter sp. COS3 TaxID=1397525 RepID=UPI0003B8AB54|nr:FimV/HubP family polar landmark protein [Acinetobacter sp. COS3]ERS02253.1 hypothetical protein Q674_01855 [Acinetobacter sp. COS3]
MTVYNKLKIAILTILSSQHLYAITLDPLQIQSAPGELLYAEMSFHQADPNAKLEVSLATPEDLVMIGATHQPPSALNFFTRRNNRGEGVIVITSSRPMTDAELNIIIKIQEDGASHLKHIRQPIRSNIQKVQAAAVSNEKALTPKFIVSEKDIALDLPESTRFNTASVATKEPTLKQEKLLNAPYELPPTLGTDNSETISATAVSVVTAPTNEQASTENTQIPVTNSSEIASQTSGDSQKDEHNNAFEDSVKTEGETRKVQNTQTKQKETTTQQTVKDNTQSKSKTSNKSSSTSNQTKQKHTVQQNESLWGIAYKISNQTNQSVTQVMKQIKAQNEHAFIGGNANRLRQGAQLNFNLNSIPSRTNQTATQIPSTTTGKTKYRLQQAEMSLVAESNQDSSTGSAKKDTLQQKTSTDLSLKIMTAREKTVTLQRNVTQLELALRQKEQRIQLLNARLAELQERLKAQ